MTALASLCTGYAGLDGVVADLLEAETAWYSEVAPHVADLLALRLPGIPNHGDITALDWSEVGPVDALTAGYPCQPFSSAGFRRGSSDDRHLWPSIAQAMTVLRPRVAVFENVAGHLTLGLDVVLADLARMGYAVEYGLFRASDVGACHRRTRLFIVATTDAPPLSLPALARVQPDGWQTPQIGLFGDAPLTLPRCGAVRNGTLHARNALLIPEGIAHPLLPSPRAANADGRNDRVWRRPDDQPQNLENALALLPSPTARDWKGENQRGDETCLPGAVSALLPTPEASDASGGRVASELGGTRPSGAKRGVSLASALVHELALLPTPRTSDMNGVGDHGTGGRDLRTEIADLSGAWGKFAPAIQRHAAVLGREAPAPVDDRRRLSHHFVEWMMMLPEGWVTELLPRRPALKALGNGVVPPQARCAVSQLFFRLGL